jgi:hypothetical protein
MIVSMMYCAVRAACIGAQVADVRQ